MAAKAKFFTSSYFTIAVMATKVTGSTIEVVI